MIDLQELKKTLSMLNLAEVSRQTGVPYFRLHGFVKHNSNPRYDTVATIYNFLKGNGFLNG